jgi:hypothetical protein
MEPSFTHIMSPSSPPDVCIEESAVRILLCVPVLTLFLAGPSEPNQPVPYVGCLPICCARSHFPPSANGPSSEQHVNNSHVDLSEAYASWRPSPFRPRSPGPNRPLSSQILSSSYPIMGTCMVWSAIFYLAKELCIVAQIKSVSENCMLVFNK